MRKGVGRRAFLAALGGIPLLGGAAKASEGKQDKKAGSIRGGRRPALSDRAQLVRKHEELLRAQGKPPGVYEFPLEEIYDGGRGKKKGVLKVRFSG